MASHPHHRGHGRRSSFDVDRDVVDVNPLFTRAGEATAIVRDRLPDDEMSPSTAYQIVRDEAMLDGNARLNLATFVGTWMEDQAARLLVETADKNLVDKDEYPMTAAIEERCWRMLAELWHTPDPERSIGTSTVGSSEAAMLAGLALKRRWQHARRAAGLDVERPNLVVSSAVQVCWEKFCDYFEVEPRYVPISAEHPVLDGSQLDAVVDERTIGVVAIMGVTYTGRYEPVAELSAALDAIATARGVDVPLHVDAASGGMVAPFLQPDLDWDFRVPRVASINVSGHKYGLTYPGLGWIVWRDTTALPEDLVFKVSYLGGEMPTFGLNFSRPGSQVLLQYYLFLRLGRDGFTRVQSACRDVARHLAREIGAMPEFELVSDGGDIPVLAYRLTDRTNGHWTLHHLSDRLRMHGWLVPSYPLPAGLTDVTVQRVVVRNGFSRDLADVFLRHVREETAYLESLEANAPDVRHPPAFAH